MCTSSPSSNSLLPLCSLALLLPPWLLTSATATVWTWSAAATRSTCRTPSSALLRQHVQTLKLNRHAGKRPPYTMRALRLLPAKRA